MPRGRKKKIQPENVSVLQELITQNEELKEDNRILTEVAKNLREFNKDLITDNLDSAQTIQTLEGQIDNLKSINDELIKDNKAKIVQAISITIIILAWLVLMWLGIWGK